MATCFDSIESLSGLLKNRSTVSNFVVHSGIPNAFGIPERATNFDTLYLFFRRPDDDSILSKHVAIRIIRVINYCVLLSRNTNKMQLCNRIYYSKVYWRLNMFRAAHRSSSGALNCTCSLWFIYTCGDRPLPWQRPVTTWVYKSEAASRV